MMIPTTEREQETVNIDRFLEISADIAYRLSGTSFDSRALLDIILLGVEAPCPEDILVRAIQAARVGYGDRKRKLGPLAVLHPLRVATILSRITKNPTALDILLALLHDRDEDLTPALIGKDWAKMYEELNLLADSLGTDVYGRLEEGVCRLTHKKEVIDYGGYIANLMQEGHVRPEVLRVKLADRLDNTLDVGVIRHGIPGRGVFAMIFDSLFLPNYCGPRVPYRYVPLTQDEGVQLLANLFKNAEFISLLRSEECDVDGTTARLLDALLLASLRIAGFITQDAFAFGLDVPSHHGTIEEVMNYCLGGGLAAVRDSGSHPLDGLFINQYAPHQGRKTRLRAIFNDRYMLARVGLTFLAVFSSFLNDDRYRIDGIHRDGMISQLIPPLKETR